ncbi:MAG TPA: efflux RND transporter periplasmic adaptor subunit [Planctomicrobium sp.]|nr:efflux RND transporter periplasmic adaptor subunit [Planctomicrobium sp.]
MKAFCVLVTAMAVVSISACDKPPEIHHVAHAGAPHGSPHDGSPDTAAGAHTAVPTKGHKKEHKDAPHGGHHEARHKIVVTSPLEKDVTVAQQYVCQIRSRRHIEVRALQRGYLESINIKEGQMVEEGKSLFKILPVLYRTKLDAEVAEARLAQLEYNYTKKLFEDNVVSQNEVMLLEAKLKRAQAKVELAEAELGFTNVKAPYPGIVDRIRQQLGSLIEEGDVLTTLSDNSVMWVYFNVPEARYLEYVADLELPDGSVTSKRDDDDDDDDDDEHLKVELILANGKTFSEEGKIGAIEADFNNETGNISFRADFPNPKGLLRHGQTGTIVMNKIIDDAIVIPQRAAFEILARPYVFVVDKEGIVHQRDIVISHTLDDIYLIKEGLDEDDKIVLEGVMQVHDGEKVDYEFRDPKKVMGELKFKAE